MIDPQLPYVYLPRAEFISFGQAIQSIYGVAVCSESEGTCFFDTPCNEVTRYNITTQIRLFDNVNGYADLAMENADNFLDGENVFDSQNKCFIPVFMHEGVGDMWYLGNIFMRNYYVSFDMTPYDEHGKDYIQVGFGVQSTADWVPQEHTEMEKLIKENGGKDPRKVTNPQIPDGESGGSGVAVFLIILLILGGAGFFLYKKKDEIPFIANFLQRFQRDPDAQVEEVEEHLVDDTIQKIVEKQADESIDEEEKNTESI